MTGYVCRVHNDRAVNWRGTGCPDCAADAEKRRIKKEEKRQARLERQKYVDARSK